MKRNEKSREAEEGKWMTRNETPKESRFNTRFEQYDERKSKLYRKRKRERGKKRNCRKIKDKKPYAFKDNK